MQTLTETSSQTLASILRDNLAKKIPTTHESRLEAAKQALLTKLLTGKKKENDGRISSSKPE